MNPELFLRDVELAPQALDELAGTLRENPWHCVDLTGVQRVLLLGMGSSAYAAATVARWLRAAGSTVVADLASAEASWPAEPGTLVVAVSATGASAETLAAARRYQGSGRLAALVEDTSSELAAMADGVVPLHAGPEGGGVACRTYRHTLIQLLALGAALGHRGPDLAEAVRRAAGATDDLLARREQWLPGTLAALDGPDGVAVLAPAERLASAQQSALMLREGPRRPATASETGDWAHVDVYLTKTTDYRALLLTGSRWDAQALEWLAARGSRVVAVGADVPGAAAAVRHRDDDMPLVRLLTEVTVAELVAASWWLDEPRT